MSASVISRVRRTAITSAVLAISMTIAPAASLHAQQKPPDTQAGDAKAAVAVYKPPLRGAPGGRVGGGTRGTGREAFVLSVLAPNHTGLTTSEQPSLFWYISNASSYPVELTLIAPDKTEPLIELRIDPPVAAGVHRIRLSDHKVRLAPGTAYQWYVAVVPDGGRRSKDILAGGMIERVAVPDGLMDKISGVAKVQLPSLYAEAGLWYDAMAALNELIDQTPNDPALREQRSALLRQIGLPDAN